MATSFIRGWVRLEGREDSLHRDHGGVRIELVGSKLATNSNWEGRYTIDSVPAGLYTLVYSADGYDSAVVESKLVLAPNGALVDGITLVRSFGDSINLDEATMSDWGLFRVRGSVGNLAGPTIPVTLFFGRSTDVSPEWSSHDASVQSFFRYYAGQYEAGFNISEVNYRTQQKGSRTFKDGDSAYVIACTGGNFSIIDIVSGNPRRVSLGEPSNVVGFVVR